MMEAEKNNALKQALARRQNGSLPSNFSFRMMEQIRLEVVRQERRKNRLVVVSLIAAVLVILGVFVYCLFFYLDFSPESLKSHLSTDSVSLYGFYTYIAVLVLALLGADYWMRKKKSISK